MLKTIVVDDEPKVCDTLIALLSMYCAESVQIVGKAHSVQDARDKIQEHRPDLVLLDIKLQDGSGFDLLEQFEAIHFAVVFITSYNEYAIKAFKFSALDYLLKPVEPQELIESINRVIKHRRPESFEVQFNHFLNQTGDQTKKPKKIILKTVDAIYIVDVKDIIRCEADGSYTNICLQDGRSILVSKNLKEYELLLKEHGFYRIHRAHLVNVNHFDRLDKREGGVMVMKDQSVVPVANQKKEELLQLISTF